MLPDGKFSWRDRADAAAWWLSGGLLGPVWRFVAAIGITTGPWLLAIAALGLIGRGLQPVLPNGAIQDLNLSITYAFCLASLIAGPVGTITARAVRSAVEERDGAQVYELFVVATVTVGVTAQILATGLCFGLGLGPLGLSIAQVFLSVATAMLWVSFSVVAVLRSYRFMIGAFAAGMVLSVVSAVLTVRLHATAEVAIWSFATGLFLCSALCLAHVGRSFGQQTQRIKDAAQQSLRQFRANRHLALAVFVAVCAVWADKWMFWFGPVGMRSLAGFAHFEPYDSVTFLAQLSIIPTFATMFLLNETEIARGVADFRRSIREHATFAVIREAVGNLGQLVWTRFFRIGFIQATVTAILALAAPFLANALHFSAQQLALLPIALISVFLQSIAYLACAVLILCNRTRTFLWVQLFFLVTNVLCSITSYLIVGVSVYGLFVSSALFATVSAITAFRALGGYDYLVYLGENDSLYSRK